MGVPGRAFSAALLSLLYVGAAAWKETGTTRVALVALLGLPALLGLAWRNTAARSEQETPEAALIRACFRAAFWGSALWLAAHLAPPGRPAFDVAANAGAATAATAACIALARMPSLKGLLKPASLTRSFDAAAFTALLWSIAVAVPLARIVLPGPGVWLDPLAIDYTTTTAAVASLLVLMAGAWRARRGRRLELGIADRAAGALALSTTAFAVSVPAAAADIAAPDRILPIAVLAASLAVIYTTYTRHAAAVSRVLRATMAVMVLGVPLSLFSAVLIRENPEHAPGIALACFVLCILVGLVARAAAQPLGPEHSRWLLALEAASRGALDPEPDAALVGALRGLKQASSDPQAKAEIWCSDPEQVLSVDVAGYLHSERASAPARLYELALEEPERTLRTEVLRALEVRKPEARPLLGWLEARAAFSATAIVDDEGPIGMIVLPKGQRKSPLTLEEAEAIRALADRISALLAVSSLLARARERELGARKRVETLEAEQALLQRKIASEPTRHRAFAELLARPARAANYSPAARLAHTQLERLATQSSVVAFTVPIGVDAAAWAATLHLASRRSDGPFVVIDGGAPALTLADWTDPERSPWFLAEGGTLAILSFLSLQRDIQDEIGRKLERAGDVEIAAPTGTSDADHSETAQASASKTGLIVTLPAGFDSDSAPALSSNVKRHVATHQLPLPALRDRTEDLRALVFEQLSRTPPRTGDEPLGIEPTALRALLQHTWPGNDLELRDVVTRAVAVARGPLITLDDLTGIHFKPDEHAPPANVPPDAPVQLSARRGRRATRRK